LSEGRADILGKRFSFEPSDFQSVTVEQKKSIFSLHAIADNQKIRKMSNYLEYEVTNRVDTPIKGDLSPPSNARNLFAKKPTAILVSVIDEDQGVRRIGASGLESLKVILNDP
jgi:hypothetical protein